MCVCECVCVCVCVLAVGDAVVLNAVKCVLPRKEKSRLHDHRILVLENIEHYNIRWCLYS